MKTALLISTYNWPDALDLILRSVLKQSQSPDEILIADDGSKDNTRNLIESYKEKFVIPIIHIWQKDEGFRRSQILNKTISKSSSDYIIQIDGDCILHKDFIKDHINRAEEGVFLYGSRVNIRQNSLSTIFEKKIHHFPILSGHIKKRTRNLRIPVFRDLYKPSPLFSTKVRGCNISYWRKDFLEVNGYNEDIEGWGREDSELILRILNNKIHGKRLRYGGILYHIYHPQSSMQNFEENDKIQQKTIQEKLVWCENGVSKYL
ncbi:glycosyltransferase family 2 protein [Gillisia sp. CAL575]|uniref:glycosyltransferase family 2 protein n=1 Tax=Gillisia sp. CAL575 TaxID=985255 RepID=UPI00039C5221|nr:glycosyltransferase family 2 protein [Gillisia sp. CAL575]